MDISTSTLSPTEAISNSDTQTSTTTDIEILSPQKIFSDNKGDIIVLEEDLIPWQKGLDETLKIDKLSIPGTHDSGALYGGPWFECQTMTISEQLQNGIRFFDIRCRHIDNKFAIHHAEVFQNLMFEDVLTSCKEFLSQYPSEFILMRIKPEHTEENCERSFAETFTQEYYDNNLFYCETDIPSVKQIRGKIYILKQFPASFRTGTEWSEVNLQDEWAVDHLPNKIRAIKAHYNKAIQRDHSKVQFHINFISGTGMAGTPLILAQKANDLTLDFKKNNCGIIVMDYPQKVHIQNIINLNFLK